MHWAKGILSQCAESKRKKESLEELRSHRIFTLQHQSVRQEICDLYGKLVWRKVPCAAYLSHRCHNREHPKRGLFLSQMESESPAFYNCKSQNPPSLAQQMIMPKPL
jgi:hypothetical protein